MKLLIDLFNTTLFQGFLIFILIDVYFTIKSWVKFHWQNSSQQFIMNSILEERIMAEILSRQPVESMVLRGVFMRRLDYTTAIGNLEKLELIKNRKSGSDSHISITEKGYEAMEHGIESWVDNQVAKQLDNGSFKMHAGISTLEVKAFKGMQSSGRNLTLQSKYPIETPSSIKNKLNQFLSNKYVSEIIIGLFVTISGILITLYLIKAGIWPH